MHGIYMGSQEVAVLAAAPCSVTSLPLDDYDVGDPHTGSWTLFRQVGPVFMLLLQCCPCSPRYRSLVMT